MRAASSGDEGARILDQVGDTWPSRRSWPSTKKRLGARRRLADLELDLDRASCRGPTVARTDDQVAEELLQVDRLGVLARQFGVEPRGVGNVGDQPVEAAHVVLDDVHQPRLRESSFLASGRVSTALRSEVSGFFSSCATSAAKLSIASMRS